MTTPLMPVLALNAGEIVSLLIAIGVILSGIFGQANETKKTNQKRKAKRSAEEQDASVSQLEQIAQRRRQQLEALARKRRGGSPEPDNLSVTQLSERQTARAAYDERAAVIRAQETSDAVRWSDPGDRVTETTALDARVLARKTQQNRRDSLRASQRETRNAQMQERAERSSQQQRQQQAQRQKQRLQGQRAAQPPRIARVDEPVSRRVLQSAEDIQAESAIQMALDQVYAVEAIDQPHGVKVEAKSKLLALTGGRSWREAIILKEVLDQPIAMREDGR